MTETKKVWIFEVTPGDYLDFTEFPLSWAKQVEVPLETLAQWEKDRDAWNEMQQQLKATCSSGNRTR